MQKTGKGRSRRRQDAFCGISAISVLIIAVRKRIRAEKLLKIERIKMDF